jgi:hypothetical protein
MKDNPQRRSEVAYKIFGYFGPSPQEKASKSKEGDELAFERARDMSLHWLRLDVAIAEEMSFEELRTWVERDFNPGRRPDPGQVRHLFCSSR